MNSDLDSNPSFSDLDLDQQYFWNPGFEFKDQ
jgi:hypothetical protein